MLALGSGLFCQTHSEKLDILISVMAPDDMVNRSVETLMTSAKESGMPEEFRDSMNVIMHDLFKEIFDSVKVMYSKKLTDREIDDLIAFYKSPLGKKSLNLSYEFSTYFMKYRDVLVERFGKRISNFSIKNTDQQELVKALNYEVKRPGDFVSSVKSSKMPVELFYSDKWKEIPAADLNPVAEIVLANTETEMYTMLIAEPTVLKPDAFLKAVILNTRKVSSSMTVLQKELKSINGKEIISLLISANVNGIDLMYKWYLYSCPSGSMQYIAFTSRENYESDKKELDDILDGLFIQ